jgi:ATP-dependent DNA helicase 2 subunit 2
VATCHSPCLELIIVVLSALAVAVQMIDNATKGKNGNPLKYDRRIIIVTDGRGSLDTEDLDQIATKIRQVDAPIELVLLGVDFDDPDSGYKEEAKSSQKVQSFHCFILGFANML